MLNKCIFMGRLTKDPEVRYTQSAEPVAVARFSLAVDQDFKKDGEKSADFFEIEAWRQRAEFCGKYLKKGQLICVEGSMHQYSWDDKSGNKRYGYKLSANNIYFAEGKKQGGDQDGNQAGTVQNGNNGGSSNMPSGHSNFDPLAGGSDYAGFDPLSGDGDMSFNISEDGGDLPY